MSIDGWIDTTPVSRERYVLPKQEPTELISVRLPASRLRFCDEILQQGTEPSLKTKSDCLRDALDMFVDDWMNRSPETFSVRSRQEYFMETVARQRQSRERFLSNFDNEFDEAKRTHDVEALNVLYHCLQSERAACGPLSPDKYVGDLDYRIEMMKRLLTD